MNTEKAMKYSLPWSEIRKNEDVFEWFKSIIFYNDTCIGVSLLLETDCCIFHTTKLRGYFYKVENNFYFVVVAFSWGPMCQYFSPVSHLSYIETLHSEQDPVYTLLMQLPFLTSSVTV
jgi:hypothetical protein